LSLNEVSLNILTVIISPLDFETLELIIPDQYVPILDRYSRREINNKTSLSVRPLKSKPNVSPLPPQFRTLRAGTKRPGDKKIHYIGNLIHTLIRDTLSHYPPPPFT
jgi:hypothetical protein